MQSQLFAHPASAPSPQDFRAGGPYVIGTRGSPLALYQARLVQRLMGEHYDIAAQDRDTLIPLRIFTTSGDKLKGRLSDVGGKGLFVKELEEALLSGAVNLAVHSMKDVPTFREPGLALAAILKREDPRDGFIAPHAKTFMDLPEGAVLGTASLRRQAQALALRPDLQIKLLRGNVGTRLSRLKDGYCDATFLAFAGLRRLGQADVIREVLSPDQFLPAPAQGAIGIEIREDDRSARAAISPLHDRTTALEITAERSFLQALDGNCRTPIAALTQIEGDALRFRGQALSPDGRIRFARETHITLGDDAFADATGLGLTLGAEVKAEAGDAIVWDTA